MTYVHIHAPQPDAKWVDSGTCLDCKKRTRFLVFHTPWYGVDATCMKCGRFWADGEWMPLDFVRQSRQKSIDAAKTRWRRHPAISKDTFYHDL